MSVKSVERGACSKEALIVRERDLERLGKEFFPHLVEPCRREMIETLFGLRGYVLVVKR